MTSFCLFKKIYNNFVYNTIHFSQKMSFLTDELKLKKVMMTRELYEKHRPQLLDMLVRQHYNKDPACVCMSYDILFKFFEEEYQEIFTTDKCNKISFLYFDEDDTLVGNFMFQDAYLTYKYHEKALETTNPEDDFYDFDLVLVKETIELIRKYDLKVGHALYGANLVFSEKYLEKYEGKRVLALIFAMYIDLCQWWEINLNDYKYAMWVHMRKSLITISLQLFNVLEGRDFEFLANDKIKYQGKLFMVQRKDIEEVKKYWEFYK